MHCLSLLRLEAATDTTIMSRRTEVQFGPNHHAGLSSNTLNSCGKPAPYPPFTRRLPATPTHNDERSISTATIAMPIGRL